jgi:signal transduction histidine kinase
VTPRGAGLSLPVKLAAVAAVTQLALALAIVALARPSPGATVALLALLAVPIAIVYLLTRFVVGRLTVPVIDAYRRLAAGDFSAELPAATAGKDFLGLRVGFRAMADALARSLDEIRGADRERRRLFADLAHELATPTSTLLGLGAALKHGTGDRARMLELLERELARLERLTADLRDLAALDEPDLELERAPIELAPLVEAAVARAAVTGGPIATCRLTAVTATVDAMRLEQVLDNLLSNARRHAGDGAVEVTLAAADRDAVITVDDAGPGVADGELDLLGRRLARLDPSRSRTTGGHGLGLAIVRSIVARHGGTLAFARSPLGGLRVTVTVPRAPT